MDERIKALSDRCDKLFEKRTALLSLWQELAEQFYPERADFTATRYLGAEFASNLMTGYPVMVRRDLGNALSSMLRPREIEWFHITTAREDRLDHAGKEALEWMTGVQRRAMYDRDSMLARAAPEGDHDFSTFGQCVLSAELNPRKNALLYRCWHLRDVVWDEDPEGRVGAVHRKWKMTLGQLAKLFPGRLSPRHEQKLNQKGGALEEVEIRHCVAPAEDYEFKVRQPRVSVFYDPAEEGHVFEERGIWHRYYTVPRWQTVSGSQYAYSPATITALPDARLIQAMTLTLLEVGEKAANPPMVAVQGAVRSDVQLFAGGVTWADMEYDEKLGPVLREAVQVNRSGLQYGLEMRNDTRAMIAEAFYLNKLNLPPPEAGMTAFEVGQRVQEYIRQALPLFGPMEDEYNGALCEDTFELLMRNGAFGPMDDLPESLQGADIQFKFESPLHEAIEKQKGAKLLEGKALLAEAMAVDPGVAQIPDSRKALRDALLGIGWPAEWLRSEEEVQAMEQAQREAEAQAVALTQMQQGADVAKTLADANQALAPV